MLQPTPLLASAIGIALPLVLLGAGLLVLGTGRLPIGLRACVILTQAAAFSWLVTSLRWPLPIPVQQAELRAGPWAFTVLAVPLLFATAWAFRRSINRQVS